MSPNIAGNCIKASEFLSEYRETEKVVSRAQKELLSLVDIQAAFDKLADPKKLIYLDDFLVKVEEVRGAREIFEHIAERYSRKSKESLSIDFDGFREMFGVSDTYRLPESTGAGGRERNVEICNSYLRLVCPVLFNLERARRELVSLADFNPTLIYRSMRMNSFSEAKVSYSFFVDACYTRIL